MYAGRRDGVKAGQQASRQLGEGKALIAVAEVVAAGQQVTGVKVVIDLRNHAVDTIVEESGRREVVAVGTAAVSEAIGTARRVGQLMSRFGGAATDCVPAGLRWPSW